MELPRNSAYNLNLDRLLQCQAILIPNWQQYIPIMNPNSDSVQNYFHPKYIEKVEYRDIKRILESNTISQKDKNYIKKQRKLSNNRRAAKWFRLRVAKSQKVMDHDIDDLNLQKSQLESEKNNLLQEIGNYKELLKNN